MEANKEFAESLLHIVKVYGETTLSLIQLKTVEKTAGAMAAFISRMLMLLVVSFFFISINIALALWLGNLLGKNYYGFLLMGLFYAVVAVILFLLHPFLKLRFGNYFITKLIN